MVSSLKTTGVGGGVGVGVRGGGDINQFYTVLIFTLG